MLDSSSYNITSVQQYSTWWQYTSGAMDTIDPLPRLGWYSYSKNAWLSIINAIRLSALTSICLRFLRGTSPPIGLYDYFASVFLEREALEPSGNDSSSHGRLDGSSSSKTSSFLTERLVGGVEGRWPLSGQQMYQIKSGGLTPYRKGTASSLPKGFLGAVTLLVSSTYSEEDMSKYHLLGPNSYFSQSAYKLASWKERRVQAVI